GLERLRHTEAERFCGLEVDDQFEFGRQLDRQIGGLLTCENAASIPTGLAIGPGKTGGIADQSTGLGELASEVDRRQRGARRKRNKLPAPAYKERIGADKQRAGPPFHQICDDRLQLAVASGPNDKELDSSGIRSPLHVA